MINGFNALISIIYKYSKIYSYYIRKGFINNGGINNNILRLDNTILILFIYNYIRS